MFSTTHWRFPTIQHVFLTTLCKFPSIRLQMDTNPHEEDRLFSHPTYLNDVSPTQFQYVILHFNFRPLRMSFHSLGLCFRPLTEGFRPLDMYFQPLTGGFHPFAWRWTPILSEKTHIDLHAHYRKNSRNLLNSCGSFYVIINL